MILIIKISPEQFDKALMARNGDSESIIFSHQGTDWVELVNSQTGDKVIREISAWQTSNDDKMKITFKGGSK